ncbi:MAG: hypothetical protein IIZ39_01655, partial [Blautia sp.]|nr:hypothetical protein [Blautia sp.]
ASDCAGFACATGHYAGRKAAEYAASHAGEGMRASASASLKKQVAEEMERLYAPFLVSPEEGISWKELNSAIAKGMQNYCGGVKCEELLSEGLDLMEGFSEDAARKLHAENPHELMRVHEVLDILEVAKLVLHASLQRKSSSRPLCFNRSDYPEMDPEKDRRHIVIRQEAGEVRTRSVPLDFFGDLKQEYEARNP